MIRYTVKTEAARQRLERLRDALTPEAIDPVVDRAAFETQAALIQATPKKWFGQVRRGWIVVKPAPGMRVVVNNNPIMIFLEEGTRAHGPVEAKALFIPLTRRAVNATARPFGISVNPRGIIQTTQSVRAGARTKTSTRTLVYGVDYVLAQHVAGITAMHIAKKQRTKTKALLLKLFKEYVRGVIGGGK